MRCNTQLSTKVELQRSTKGFTFVEPYSAYTLAQWQSYFGTLPPNFKSPDELTVCFLKIFSQSDSKVRRAMVRRMMTMKLFAKERERMGKSSLMREKSR